MVIFHSYVNLPEGKQQTWGDSTAKDGGLTIPDRESLPTTFLGQKNADFGGIEAI